MNIFKYTGLMFISTAGLVFCINTLAGELNSEATQPGNQLEYQLEYQAVPRIHYADGVIEAVKQATVSAQTSGRITEIYFDVDDFVPKDSVLLRFRNKKQQAALVETQAAVKEADAGVIETKQELKRIKGVYSKKLVAKSVLDKATAKYKKAKQRLSQVIARLSQAQEEFDRTVVTAPYDGIVVKRHVEVGETAKVGQPLFTGFSMDLVRAVVNVPQSVIGLIYRGVINEQKTYIIYSDTQSRVLDSYKKVVAKNITINPYGDPATHSFNVRVQLPTGILDIYPGMYVKVAFSVGEQKRLMVPLQAVVIRSEVTAVYVIARGGNISYRQVRLGDNLIEGYVEMLSGLQQGEFILLDPIKAANQLKAQRAAPGSAIGPVDGSPGNSLSKSLSKSANDPTDNPIDNPSDTPFSKSFEKQSMPDSDT